MGLPPHHLHMRRHAKTSLGLTREELGITQNTFGRILGIERTYLASLETRIRSTIPKSARAILDWIDRNMALFNVPEPAVVPEEKKIQFEIRKLRSDKERLLDKIGKRLAKDKNLYQTGMVCKVIQAHYPQMNERLQKHLESMAYDADLSLEILREEPILRLKARIKGIEAEIQALEEGIAEVLVV